MRFRLGMNIGKQHHGAGWICCGFCGVWSNGRNNEACVFTMKTSRIADPMVEEYLDLARKESFVFVIILYPELMVAETTICGEN